MTRGGRVAEESATTARGDGRRRSAAGARAPTATRPAELAQQLQGGMGIGGGVGGMSAPPPSDELGLPSDSDDSDEGSDSEDDVPELVENFDEAQK